MRFKISFNILPEMLIDIENYCHNVNFFLPKFWKINNYLEMDAEISVHNNFDIEFCIIGIIGIKCISLFYFSRHLKHIYN